MTIQPNGKIVVPIIDSENEERGSLFIMGDSWKVSFLPPSEEIRKTYSIDLTYDGDPIVKKVENETSIDAC